MKEKQDSEMIHPIHCVASTIAVISPLPLLPFFLFSFWQPSPLHPHPNNQDAAGFDALQVWLTLDTSTVIGHMVHSLKKQRELFLKVLYQHSVQRNYIYREKKFYLSRSPTECVVQGSLWQTLVMYCIFDYNVL